VLHSPEEHSGHRYSTRNQPPEDKSSGPKFESSQVVLKQATSTF